MKSLDKMYGGNHYKKFVIEPAEFTLRNNLSWAIGNCLKYICRHQDKGGKEDLLKAIHYIEMEIERLYSMEEK